MKFIFFQKLFKVRGNNNVSDSKGVSINDNKISTYCKDMINRLMNENDAIVNKNEHLINRNTELIIKITKLEKENRKLKNLLKGYIEE